MLHQICGKGNKNWFNKTVIREIGGQCKLQCSIELSKSREDDVCSKLSVGSTNQNSTAFINMSTIIDLQLKLKVLIKYRPYFLQTFQGNTNHSTIATNKLPQPFIAQYIRVYAEQWYIGVCLRVEFYGCTEGASFLPTAPTTPTVCRDFRLVTTACRFPFD